MRHLELTKQKKLKTRMKWEEERGTELSLVHSVEGDYTVIHPLPFTLHQVEHFFEIVARIDAGRRCSRATTVVVAAHGSKRIAGVRSNRAIDVRIP